MNNPDIAIPIILTTFIILLLIAGLTIAFFVSGRQRIRQQVALAEARLKYEQELRRAEAEISEDMMARFARELHDNVGHTLTCIRLSVENQKLDNPGLAASFIPIDGYLDEAAEQLRLLSRSLNSDYITNVGLAAAIGIEVDRAGKLLKQQVHYQHKGQDMLPDKNRQLMAFRVFQEMLHNTLKHARARNLYVTLDLSDGFMLELRDDGVGFAVEEMLRSEKASGLINMIRRAEIAGMECLIESAPGKGCRYRLQSKQDQL